ncbi:hypothetical protein [Actinomadura madurae]|uniref:hypothetical protein n=1 Tax=Actinomadura madurae TaxID=1993 RepID=UPI0020D24001|nr:hypothetical protein [Actinomadura madurae]MCQ0015696.1 hypothetical protein [Actinomadura madurae]
MTEAQARDQNLPVRTAVAPIAESARGWIHKARQRRLREAGGERRMGHPGPARPPPPGRAGRSSASSPWPCTPRSPPPPSAR